MIELTRREFVKVSTTGAAAMALASAVPLAAPGMPERPLGRTGHKARLFSLGGQAVIEKPGTQDVSVAIVNRAIDLGVNYLDTAAGYGRGISETYYGEVLKTRRKEVFLASKTRDRTRDGSLKILDESLKRLHTDHLDLWQLHNVMTDEDLDKIFGKDGAIEALQRAQDQKMVRFLGITGHFNPEVLARGIKRFPFDTILMALNPADKHRLSFINTLLPLANKKQMGVIAMKIPARGRLFKEGGITSMRDALSYVMTLPVSTVIVGVDNVAQLEENISVARDFKPMSTADMARLEQLTASYVSDASWFKKPAAGAGPAGDDQGMDH